MKLAEKGRYAPPPVLPTHAQAVSKTVATWPDVHARTHWQLGDETLVDGADFYVGERELGHIHLYGEAHIALPKRVRDAVIAAALAQPFPWSQAFVVRSITTALDVPAASALFQLAYDHLRGTGVAELVARVSSLPRASRSGAVARTSVRNIERRR